MDQTQINPPRPPPPKSVNTHESEPATYYPFPPPPPPGHRRRRSSKCLVYALLAVILLSVSLLILGRLVLRVKTPTLRMSAAAVASLRHSPPYLNMTLTAGIVLRNPNFGRFDFRAGKVILSHENSIIGKGNIRAGSVGVRERREMRVTVRVSYMNFSGGGGGGDLMRVRSYAEVRGEVRVLGMMKRRKSNGVMNCRMDFNMGTWEIQGLLCF